MRPAKPDLGPDDRDLVLNVLPVEDRKLRVLWQSGLTEVLDLWPILVRFSRRSIAVHELLFHTAKPGPNGQSIVWDDGSEVSASWLRDLALESMTNAEFRAALAELTFTVEEAAAHLGVSKRSIAGYRTDREIPRAVSLAVRFLVHRHIGRGT